MCGIAGVILKNGDESYLDRAATTLDDCLFHRGPDSGGMHRTNNGVFLNRRLAIVGIEGGDQPQYSADGTKGIVYNGEIYNFQSLRKELLEDGYSFGTNTDTEVALRLFERDGPESFERFEGMFGVFFWDESDGSAYLVRDRFGMKPMYVYEDDSKYVFASEISAILALPDIDHSLDAEGIVSYLTYRYCPAPNTIFKNIKRLRAGNYLRFQPGSSAVEVSYARLRDADGDSEITDFEQAKDLLRTTLRQSVSDHLISEVPVALLLSGGVDSSILAGLLHELDTSLECFNIGFPDVNEFEFSTAVGERHGLPVHNVEVTERDMLTSLPAIIQALDEPVADPACFPLHLLAGEVAKYATVVLSGEGADEMFGGYPQYWNFRADMPAGERLPDFLDRSYYFRANEDIVRRKPSRVWHQSRKHFRGSSVLSSMSNHDFSTWVPDNLMMKADKILMQHSLEGRFPFLAPSVHALSHQMPSEFMVTAEGRSKHILKEAFADLLPDIVTDRPKMGFSVPVALLLRTFDEQFSAAIDSLGQHEIADILNFPVINEMREKFRAGDESQTLRLWTIFILVAWLASRESVNYDRRDLK